MSVVARRLLRLRGVAYGLPQVGSLRVQACGWARNLWRPRTPNVGCRKRKSAEAGNAKKTEAAKRRKTNKNDAQRRKTPEIRGRKTHENE